MWSLVVQKVSLPYHMGKPLELIDAAYSMCLSQVVELKQKAQELYLRIFIQMSHNLMGKSDQTVILDGDVFHCSDPSTLPPDTQAMLVFADYQLLVFFGEFERAAEISLDKGGVYQETFGSGFLGMLEVFHRGIALYAMARKTKKRKYKKAARQILSTITKWVLKENPNVKHCHSLLSAEQAVLDKNLNAADIHYKASVKVAARSGFLHHAALANERYADFLQNELGDEEEAKYRLEEAARFYKSWGADAKVELLYDRIES
jgi:hypothetical protein